MLFHRLSNRPAGHSADILLLKARARRKRALAAHQSGLSLPLSLWVSPFGLRNTPA